MNREEFRKTHLAHSENDAGATDPVAEHSLRTAELAEKFASVFRAGPEARAAGLLHDLGKYGPLFQRRLQGLEKGVDHWSLGAWQSLMKYRNDGLAVALAIQGHHLGLKRAGKDDLQNLNPDKLKNNHPLGLRLSAAGVAEVLEQFHKDGLSLPTSIGPSHFPGLGRNQAAAMVDVRMLFSALVDADYLDTEAHFQGKPPDGGRDYRPSGPALDAGRLFSSLMDYLGGLAAHKKASGRVLDIRRMLLDDCLAAAGDQPGLFTLTAPTGAGKTLSLLAFALKHAQLHGLRRIVVVIPYLTIIEQTADEYRRVLAPALPRDRLDAHILEHHSLAGLRTSPGNGRGNDEYGDGKNSRLVQWLTENWDAPIVLTTSVQFFESLFANRPGPCRKLHRLADAVILFDEAQTLPAQLAVPTLAALARLAEKYRTTVVFSTATQPAFEHLDSEVKKISSVGWSPREITGDAATMFALSRRVRVEWRNARGATTPLSELALELSSPENRQVLCILNLKRHALGLLDLLENQGVEDVFHLSTNMCPAHRRVALEEVRARLNDNVPCRLISTQCVEAGVDVDFPVVYRAHGPLEAAAQAAGRCNRHGLRPEGRVVVFVPGENGRLYPDPGYGQAAAVANMMLKEAGEAGLDIADPELFRKYYQTLYDFTRPGSLKKELTDAVKILDFEETARQYKLIAQNSINVLCPWDLAAYRALADTVRTEGLTGRWTRAARAHSISLFQPQGDDPVRKWLEPVPVGRGRYSEEWFIYLNEGHYDRVRGLTPPSADEILIA
ncbi:MAG: CRISPR-associated endonuclease Cas3'' [Pseudomonadota bacterium]